MRGEIIREARKNKGLTISELATFLGLSPLTIQKIERGVIATPTPKTQKLLTDFLNLPSLYSEEAEKHFKKIEALQSEIERLKNLIINF